MRPDDLEALAAHNQGQGRTREAARGPRETRLTPGAYRPSSAADGAKPILRGRESLGSRGPPVEPRGSPIPWRTPSRSRYRCCGTTSLRAQDRSDDPLAGVGSRDGDDPADREAEDAAGNRLGGSERPEPPAGPGQLHLERASEAQGPLHLAGERAVVSHDNVFGPDDSQELRTACRIGARQREGAERRLVTAVSRSDRHEGAPPKERCDERAPRPLVEFARRPLLLDPPRAQDGRVIA